MYDITELLLFAFFSCFNSLIRSLIHNIDHKTPQTSRWCQIGIRNEAACVRTSLSCMGLHGYFHIFVTAQHK